MGMEAEVILLDCLDKRQAGNLQGCLDAALLTLSAASRLIPTRFELDLTRTTLSDIGSWTSIYKNWSFLFSCASRATLVTKIVPSNQRGEA